MASLLVVCPSGDVPEALAGKARCPEGAKKPLPPK